jgi:hypothetical protein
MGGYQTKTRSRSRVRVSTKKRNMSRDRAPNQGECQVKGQGHQTPRKGPSQEAEASNP